MLGHEIFDPDIGKHVLVDHAFIVAGGGITKAAKNWLGSKLDASRRSQIMFMDRDDILNLSSSPICRCPSEPYRSQGRLKIAMCHTSQAQRKPRRQAPLSDHEAGSNPATLMSTRTSGNSHLCSVAA